MFKNTLKKLICVVCLFSLITGTTQLYNTTTSASGNYNLDKVDTYLQQVKAASPIPGFSVVVVSGDEIIFKKGYGIEKVGENAPMTENTSTAIGSFTKSFTALAVMQLVEQGKLKLDDPVVKYIPWFRTADEELSEKITIRMLLSNSSGLPSLDNWLDQLEPSDDAMEQQVRSLSSCILSRDPGEGFEYSNEGFDTAGIVIEKVSGMKYKDYIQKNILDPLEMDRSTTDYIKFNTMRVIYGHKLAIDTAEPMPPIALTSALAAGSEFRSSAENLGHYFIALLNRGVYKGKKIISESSIQELWKPHISFPGFSTEMGGDGKDMNYGLGWMIAEIEGRKLIFHGGNTLSMSSFNIIDPSKKIAVSILMNATAVDPYKYQQSTTVVNNILHIINNEPLTDFMVSKKQDPSITDYTPPLDLIGKYTGEYIAKEGNMKLTVSIGKNGRMEVLAKSFMGSLKYAIAFINPSACYFKNMEGSSPARFQVAPTGDITGLDFMNYSFIKLSSNSYSKFKEVNLGNIQFKIPKEYTISNSGNMFEISNSSNTESKVSGAFIDNNRIDCDQTLKSTLNNDEQIISQGEINTDNIAVHIWKEKSYLIKKGNVTRQKFLTCTQLGNSTLYFILDASPGNITNNIRDLILPIMNSLDYRET